MAVTNYMKTDWIKQTIPPDVLADVLDRTEWHTASINISPDAGADWFFWIKENMGEPNKDYRVIIWPGGQVKKITVYAKDKAKLTLFVLKWS